MKTMLSPSAINGRSRRRRAISRLAATRRAGPLAALPGFQAPSAPLLRPFKAETVASQLSRIQQPQELVGAGADRVADTPKAGRALCQGHDGGIVAERLDGDERVV